MVHSHVQHNCGPQNDADRLRLDAGSPKDQSYAEIVDRHRGNQSPCCRTLRVIARKPAGYSHRKQSCSANPRHGQCGRCLQRPAEQESGRC